MDGRGRRRGCGGRGGGPDMIGYDPRHTFGPGK
jgi:hypothetical protein